MSDLTPQGVRARRSRRWRTALTGAALLAAVGTAVVGGTQASFTSPNHVSTHVKAESLVLLANGQRVSLDLPSVDAINAGSSVTQQYTLTSQSDTAGAVTGTFHLTGTEAQYLTVSMSVDGGAPVALSDGSQIPAFVMQPGANSQVVFTVTLADTNAAQGTTADLSVDWLLTAQ